MTELLFLVVYSFACFNCSANFRMSCCMLEMPLAFLSTFVLEPLSKSTKALKKKEFTQIPTRMGGTTPPKCRQATPTLSMPFQIEFQTKTWMIKKGIKKRSREKPNKNQKTKTKKSSEMSPTHAPRNPDLHTSKLGCLTSPSRHT